MAQQNWHQMAQSQQQQSFQLDLSKFGRNAFLDCQMHFLTTSTNNAMPVIYANETVPIEVDCWHISHYFWHLFWILGGS
jgi:predicted membrane channel-forming protein YqfA (hemolysin III family)